MPISFSACASASATLGMRPFTVSRLALTYASGVFTSCATPATICPSEDIFSL